MSVQIILQLSLLTLCVTSGLCGIIHFKDCKNPGDKAFPEGGNKVHVDSLSFEGCDSDTCTLEKGKSYNVSITATINFNTTRIMYQVRAIGMAAGAPVDIAIGSPINLCDFLAPGYTCSGLKEGTQLMVNRQVQTGMLPPFSGVLRNVIMDDTLTMTPKFCGEFNVVVKMTIPTVPTVPTNPTGNIFAIGR